MRLACVYTSWIFARVAWRILAVWLPSSKTTFSQPSQREMYKWGSENWQYNHPSSGYAMKSQVLHTVWCNISGEAAGEIWNWSLLGVTPPGCSKSARDTPRLRAAGDPRWTLVTTVSRTPPGSKIMKTNSPNSNRGTLQAATKELTIWSCQLNSVAHRWSIMAHPTLRSPSLQHSHNDLSQFLP